jgi:hypothetical protein
MNNMSWLNGLTLNNDNATIIKDLLTEWRCLGKICPLFTVRYLSNQLIIIKERERKCVLKSLLFNCSLCS